MIEVGGELCIISKCFDVNPSTFYIIDVPETIGVFSIPGVTKTVNIIVSVF